MLFLTSTSTYVSRCYTVILAVMADTRSLPLCSGRFEVGNASFYSPLIIKYLSGKYMVNYCVISTGNK